MVINAFTNKIIPLADGSYSQYVEGEPDKEADIYWVEKPDDFIKSSEIIKEKTEEGFNVNFDMKNRKESRNVNLKKIKKFVEKSLAKLIT